MACFYLFRGIKVSNGTGYFQDTVVSTGRKAQTLHSRFKKRQASGVGYGIFMQKLSGHLCIAIYTFVVGKTFFLNCTGINNPFTDSSTGFRRTLFGYLFKRDWYNLHLYVDTVEQRAGYTVHIFLHCPRRAKASPVRMVVITTGTRIHRGNQHKAGRIIDRETGTRNSNLSVFQRLSHHLQNTSVEFRQFAI